MSEDLSIKQLSLTYPQAFSAIQNAPVEVEISGRGVGKSASIGMRMRKIDHDMPRSTCVISGKTYAHLLTVTMAPVLSFLETIGMKRNVHYVIGNDVPKNWKLPIQAPPDLGKYIITKNGTGFPLASQDRPGMNRGRSVDHVIGDEMLDQDREKFEKEIIGSKRGNLQVFGKCPLHMGIYLKTSMPTGIDSQWLFNYGNYYLEDGYDLWAVWNSLVRLQLQFIDNCIDHETIPDFESTQAKLIKEIHEARKKIKFYKSKHGVLFTCHNAFENLKNVGLDYFINNRQSMSDLSFRIEMMNERIITRERGFYKITKDHLYTRYDYDTIDNCDFDFVKIASLGSKADGDVLKSKSLDIAIDFGAAINAMVVGQLHSENEYRFVKSFFTKFPSGLKELIDAFCNYYRQHPVKTVNIFYDQTAVGRHNVSLRHIENTEKFLRDRGWSCIKKYIGHAPNHMAKFELWDYLLSDRSKVKVFFNKENFKEALISMTHAQIVEKKSGFEKDKSPERRYSSPREEATDLSDAADMVAWGRFQRSYSPSGTFIDVKRH